MRQALQLFAALFLAACGRGGGTVNGPVADDSAGVAMSMPFDLAHLGLPLQVLVPGPDELEGDSLVVRWNEATGTLELRAGVHFGLDITEGVGDLARLKAALARDPLQKHEVLEEGPDHLLYRSTFPDPALVFVHFMAVVRADGRAFEVRDDPSGRFTEADVRRMAGAVAAGTAGKEG